MAGPERGVEIRAQAICFDGRRILCVRHRKAGEEYWVLPGGHVEPGESLWEALVREMAEETRISARAGRLWAVNEFHGGGRHVLDIAFWLDEWAGEPALGNDPEGGGHEARLVDLAWIDQGDLERIGFRPGILGRRITRRWGEADAPAAYLGVETS